MSSFTLQELCAQVDLPIRTVRYYVQIGLLDKPEGETRAARYSDAHLSQLSSIKRWSASGLSLDRIRELLAQRATPEQAMRAPVLGAVMVKTHIHIAQGLELVIDPGSAGLGPQQMRELHQGIADLYARLTLGSPL